MSNLMIANAIEFEHLVRDILVENNCQLKEFNELKEFQVDAFFEY